MGVEIVLLVRTAYRNCLDPEYKFESLKWSWKWPPISIPNPLFGTLTQYRTFHYLKLIVGIIFFVRVFKDIHDSGTRFNEALLLLLAWGETIRLLRYYSSVRWMFRMLNMILFKTIPFMVVYISYITMIAFMLMSLRDKDYDHFIDIWMTSYQLSYGQFEEDYDGDYERIIYVGSTIFLILILSNMLIAFMGTVYSQAEENKDIEDLREKLIWIQELQFQAIWDHKPRVVYMHSIADKFAQEIRSKTFQQTIRSLQEVITEVADNQKELKQNMFELLERLENKT